MSAPRENVLGQTRALYEHKDRYTLDLLRLLTEFVKEAEAAGNNPASNFLRFGVARRFDLIGNAIRNIFRLFPPERSQVLSRENLGDVQINLHAFVINLSGCFDSMAWAFVHQHDLLKKVGGPMGVGMFLASTAKFLPKAISDYVRREDVLAWRNTYLKAYRDSLAHRIPLYVPPGTMTDEQASKYNAIEKDKFKALAAGKYAELDALWDQQATLGQPCYFFLQSEADGTISHPIYLHPQILSDTGALVEFGTLFLANWHNIGEVHAN